MTLMPEGPSKSRMKKKTRSNTNKKGINSIQSLCKDVIPLKSLRREKNFT
jgi:hypothetical protein